MSEQPGPIALVGSGEYLTVMDDIDRGLLARVGGKSARVVVLATAAGREGPSSTRRWTSMGLDHFGRLGVQVLAADILAPADAHDPRWLPVLEAADFYYFSGGDPGHVITSLENSPAWQVIRSRHQHGAALAGCSAGAMAFGGLIPSQRTFWSSAPSAAGDSGTDLWRPALAIAPGVVVLPHFDRFKARLGQHGLARLLDSLPSDRMLVGIDEDTALVRLHDRMWQVQGRQTVSVLSGAAGVFAAGDLVRLEDEVPRATEPRVG
jgi:cyanophycinase